MLWQQQAAMGLVMTCGKAERDTVHFKETVEAEGRDCCFHPQNHLEPQTKHNMRFTVYCTVCVCTVWVYMHTHARTHTHTQAALWYVRLTRWLWLWWNHCKSFRRGLRWHHSLYFFLHLSPGGYLEKQEMLKFFIMHTFAMQKVHFSLSLINIVFILCTLVAYIQWLEINLTYLCFT